MKRELTCIGCPVGCQLSVELDDGGNVAAVEGNECPRGDKYARRECSAPERMVTSLMVAEFSRTPVSVKTSIPVPKAMIGECLEVIRKTRPHLPIRIGDVLIADICHTGADVVATSDVY